MANNNHTPTVQARALHLVQFFDALDTLGAAVAEFLADGLAQRANAVVLARPASVQAISRAFTHRGLSLESLIGSGRVTLVDAAATVRSLMNGQTPDPARFDAVMGGLVRQLGAESPGGLLVYGEMVEILATEGNFDAAAELEELWNTLAATHRFTLLCGYLAAHFTAPAAAGALRTICRSHARVRQDRSDLLASWLLHEAKIAS